MPAAHPPEFRRRALDLVAQGNPVGQTARDLGISESCLRNWMNRDAVDSGRKPGLTTDEHKELVELRRRLRVLEMENEILKRARVNSTRQRNTIDDHLGGVAWRRSGDRVYRRIGGNRCGSCGRRERRSVRSLERWGHRQDRSSRSCCRSAASTKRRSAVGRGR
ncbi:transposase [Microbacterium sp. VKM Ac-2870]|nr:transposase [Microbacterium sp. VKM Ac-2870]